ncbi:DUF2255 family protein [Agromyces sp. NPDC058484]|uniref:DUF2255 family protein n=1 Tax=Agromyces sp. NPDC058484 TaxID=3346524 RepID=UPI0036539838
MNVEALHAYLADRSVVTVVTTRQNGDDVSTPIWSVVVDDVPYIRSEYGSDGRWYRRATARGRVGFEVGDDLERVVVERVTDDAELSRVDDAYRVKYRTSSSSLEMMLRPLARACTLRITP